MVLQYIYTNDELIRLNKFVSWITDGFCNLLFISIRTAYATYHMTPMRYLKTLHPESQQGISIPFNSELQMHKLRLQEPEAWLARILISDMANY